MGLLGGLGKFGGINIVAGLMKKKKRKDRLEMERAAQAPVDTLNVDPLAPIDTSNGRGKGFADAFADRAKSIDQEERQRRIRMRGR